MGSGASSVAGRLQDLTLSSHPQLCLRLCEMSSHKLRPGWCQRTHHSLHIGDSALWSQMGRWPRSAQTDRVSLPVTCRLLVHLL